MSIIQTLSEGIVNRDMKKEGAALLDKWTKTGLLEGLQTEQKKQNMARLLENQAKELLRESSSMGAGDVEGFAAVAFPIVRRVFAGLIANDLVSVQPMSLPSGLIFFLDFTYGNPITNGESSLASRLGGDKGDSIYGGGAVAKEIVDGVDDITELGGGMYNSANAYSHATGSISLAEVSDADPASMHASTEEINDGATIANTVLPSAGVAVSALTATQKKALQFDVDVLSATSTDLIGLIVAKVTAANMTKLKNNPGGLAAFQLMTAASDGAKETFAASTGPGLIRRLTEFGYRNANGDLVASSKDRFISFYIQVETGVTVNLGATCFLIYPLADEFAAGGSVGSVGNPSAVNWQLESSEDIPEIDIKVDSIAITAQTKKLKAKWTPELGQDLNAYHNLDAEVELTSILSEQIALEIDREILADLVNGATAGTYYWSRSPGLFVNRTTGAEIGQTSAAPDFTGTVSEWYETLIETMNDVSAQIHRKTLRGGANFCVVSPEVANILEFTSGFRANVTADADKGDIGAVKTGSLSRKFDVIVDPYFPRNVILMGRKGSSFLESGYVYAPYVPLQVTPTIFGVEDFVPRKGVMTRYAKKMVRPDMYGLVIVRGLLGEAGATS